MATIPAFVDSNSDLNVGFAEPADSWLLASRFFRSKLGGTPSWLDLTNLPDPSKDLQCKKCDERLVFLCQIYAPIDGNPDCFHRVIFVFTCRNAPCHAPCCEDLPFKVFRCQMGRKNEFYSYEPAVENPAWMPEVKAGNLCRSCGGRASGSGSGRCGGCGKVEYCCRSHQSLDWKRRHKKECKGLAKLEDGPLKGLLFPEFGIVISNDDESDVSEVEEEEDDEENAEEMETFKKLEEEGRTGEMSAEELSKYVKEATKEDKEFKRFKKVIKSAPDQIIRYERGSQRPLWVSGKSILEPEDVPDCEECGSRRVFEFQILPQMLNHMKVDASVDGVGVDWGTLAVYTCSKSCNEANSPAYKTEFLWRQFIS